MSYMDAGEIAEIQRVMDFLSEHYLANDSEVDISVVVTDSNGDTLGAIVRKYDEFVFAPGNYVPPMVEG